ncbi:hypothetical protein GCM10014715_39850 [Streptomyces spiralis]|uniref:Uncharacterized protein n=1 Tax=Streptomyces spiralis TaxID=66376 RepID=A0A919A0C6_9ACTN|nr:hypothetical protein [Streptomyces spiralis]GHE80432.1 hypothetical protein GCM10014715_39850 [Streptomyces spiralis]
MALEKEREKPRVKIHISNDNLPSRARDAVNRLMEELQAADVEVETAGCQNFVSCGNYSLE